MFSYFGIMSVVGVCLFVQRLYDFGIVVLWVVQDFFYFLFFSCWTRRLFDLES